MPINKFDNLLAVVGLNIALSKQEGLNNKEAFLKEADDLSIVLCTTLDTAYNINMPSDQGEELAKKVIDFITEELILFKTADFEPKKVKTRDLPSRKDNV